MLIRLMLSRWLPPLQTSAHEATVRTAAQRGGLLKDRDRPLSEVQRDRFEDMLRNLTQERADVAEAMIFALDHAECATEVSTRATFSWSGALDWEQAACMHAIWARVSRAFVSGTFLFSSIVPGCRCSQGKDGCDEPC